MRGSDIEEILLIVRGEDIPALGHIADQLRILPVPVTWIAHGADRRSGAPSLVRDRARGRVQMQKPPRSLSERALKRVVDVTIASGALIASLPLLLLVAIAIKLDSKGPVLFWQTRRGFNGKPFRISKFRSMSVLEDGDNIRQATRRDARVTRVGAWLRQTSHRRDPAAPERVARRHVAGRPAPACGRA